MLWPQGNGHILNKCVQNVSFRLKVGHGNFDTAPKFENNDDLSTLRCCNTPGFALWMHAKHFHMSPVFPVRISQWPRGGKSSSKQKLRRKPRLQTSWTYFIFISILSVLFCAAHSDCLCRRWRTCRLNENFKPLKESSGTSYTTDLSKLGGSYALVNSMRNRKGSNTWKLEGRGKEG